MARGGRKRIQGRARHPGGQLVREGGIGLPPNAPGNADLTWRGTRAGEVKHLYRNTALENLDLTERQLRAADEFGRLYKLCSSLAWGSGRRFPKSSSLYADPKRLRVVADSSADDDYASELHDRYTSTVFWLIRNAPRGFVGQLARVVIENEVPTERNLIMVLRPGLDYLATYWKLNIKD